MDIHSTGHSIFSFTHMEGVTLGTGEDVYELAGGTSDVGEVGDRASEGQTAGVYGTGLKQVL